MSTERTAVERPPQDRQAEMALIGALMIDNNYIPNVCTIISPDDFHERRHRSIFESIVALFEENITADIVTVGNRLVSDGKLEMIGGYAFLVELTENVYFAANCEQYAEIVKEKSILRKLIALAGTLRDKAERMEGDVKDLLDLAESRIFEIASHRSDKGFSQLKDLLPSTFSKMELREQI